MLPNGERRSKKRLNSNSFDTRKRWLIITAVALSAVFIVISLQFASLWLSYQRTLGPNSRTQEWVDRKLINYSLDSVNALNALQRLETAVLLCSTKQISVESLTLRRRQLLAMMDHFKPGSKLWNELRNIESYDEAYLDANAFIEAVQQYELGKVDVHEVITLAETSINSWALFKTESTQQEFSLRDNMEASILSFRPLAESAVPVIVILICLSAILIVLGFYSVSTLIKTQHRRYRSFELLVASISHDLNSPLQAIQSAGSLLGNRLSPSDRRKYSAIVNTSIKRLTRLVRDISLAAQGANGELQLAYIDFEKWVSEFIIPYKESATKKGLELTLKLDVQNVMVEIDAERVAQSIGNLLDNAIKYTTKGAISVSIRLRSHEVAGHRRLLVVRVQDTGSGISESDFDRIFKPFERAVPIGHPQEHGMGLGLSIVQRLAKSHGGTVSVKSKVGVGSVFKLTLPVNTKMVEASTPWKKQSNFDEDVEQISQPSMVKEILVVDDDADISATIVGILHEAGFAVDTAHDGVEALASMADHSYRVVITDIQMPGLNGFELARAIRSLVGRSTPYIIGMTAKQENLASDPKAGVFNGTLSKPFDEEELIYLIEQGMDGDQKATRGSSVWGGVLNK